MTQPGRLEVITGPMGSGKTAEIIARMERYRFAAEYQLAAFQPHINVREDHFKSRLGMSYPCRKVDSLNEIETNGINVVAIEEAHMFDDPDHEIEWITRRRQLGLHMLISCIDIDYRGEMTSIMRQLYQLGPDKITRQTAACLSDGCNSVEARNTALFIDGERQREGEVVIPDIGNVVYKALCAGHFFDKAT